MPETSTKEGTDKTEAAIRKTRIVKKINNMRTLNNRAIFKVQQTTIIKSSIKILLPRNLNKNQILAQFSSLLSRT